MTPWEIADKLASEDQDSILAGIAADDPFWVGASYAMDPFVGIIYRLPLRDPRTYGRGVPPQVFDKLARYTLDAELTGDSLALAIEQFSMHCQEPEWTRWYRPILKGELNLGLPLDLFNRYAPDQYSIPLPALNRPKPIKALTDLPRRFVVTPNYGDRVFWLINSKVEPIEICAYDAQIRHYSNLKLAAKMADFARTRDVDIVLVGFVQGDVFFAEDILTRDQFTQETGAQPLHHRLLALAKLDPAGAVFPLVQMSDLLTPGESEQLYRELGLIFEQRFDGAIVRDLDAKYPFRVQNDLLIRPTLKATLTAQEIVPGQGIKGEYIRGKKRISTIVRLGLTESMLVDISGVQDKRFDVLSCGVKDGELLFPVFKNWRK